jgi:hypothetical protein
MIDAISEAEGIPLRTIQHKALLGKGTTFCTAFHFSSNSGGSRFWEEELRNSWNWT